MKRSEFLHKIGVLPVTPFLFLNSDSLEMEKLAKRCSDTAENLVGIFASSKKKHLITTGEKPTSYGMDFHPKHSEQILFGWKHRIIDLINKAHNRGGDNPAILYWGQEPTITKSPDRFGYWRFEASLLISKKKFIATLP